MEIRILLALTLLLFASCSGFETNENGLKYKMYYSPKDGRKIKEGDMVLCYYTLEYEDSVLYSTYNFPDPARIVAFPSKYKGDLFEALQMMKEGDSTSFLFQADSFYIKTFNIDKPAFILENKEIVCTMKIFKVLDEIEYEAYLKREEKLHLELEDKHITDYIRENYLMMEYDSFTKVRYFVENPDSILISSQDIITFHCLAKTTTGITILNTYTENKPITIQVGHNNFNIPVLDDLVQFLSDKGSGKFIVPYMSCFGPKGDGYKIPQYSTFVFDIFIEEVQK